MVNESDIWVQLSSASADEGHDFHFGAIADERDIVLLAPDDGAIYFNSDRARIDSKVLEEPPHRPGLGKSVPFAIQQDVDRHIPPVKIADRN
jgi:hypothetical protein